MVSTWLLPSFWKNLKQYRCSSHSVIFAENNNATRAAYALSLTRWLHVTDTVCWWEKIHVCALKVPSTSLPQHTSRASLFSAEKNHVRHFLNSPHRLLKEVLGCATAIILTVCLCEVKIFPLLEQLP